MKYMWEGRFKEKAEKDIIDFTKSIDIDKKLAIYDIEGSIAHVKMLFKVGLITKKEKEEILDGLKKIKKEINENKLKFLPTDEDIHTVVERRLIELIGKTGEKLHTARSRNDQIVLDEKLFLRDEIIYLIKQIISLQNCFLKKSEECFDIIISSYTHLKQSQPVLLSHYFLAYIEKLERDKERFLESYKRVNIFPLGVGACAGTSLPIDREYTAKLLNFPAISKNSLDTVSDRDFLIEVVFCCVLTLIHLSSFSQDLIIWNMDEIDFVKLPDRYCTGSSLMPHKKNPDVFELIRGKTSSCIGLFTGLLTLVKGLPLSYNRDLQEDKKPLFEIIEITKSILKIISKVVPKIEFNKEIIKNKISSFTLSTDIAEYLVKKGKPFREAYIIVGNIVNYCIENNKTFFSLTLDEFKKFSQVFENDIFKILNFESSVNVKISDGGTSSINVKREIGRWKKKLEKSLDLIISLEKGVSILRK
ncbi:MAG: argininosuccinate lyase [Candidatus Omnitrophica bacterium]|nr:argininosuccinate lyase [Candidatus Omnitrophota bacterium]MCM8801747.1 argininosuccinate lyase [Candidatus Omnitrophota bacterium]